MSLRLHQVFLETFEWRQVRVLVTTDLRTSRRASLSNWSDFQVLLQHVHIFLLLCRLNSIGCKYTPDLSGSSFWKFILAFRQPSQANRPLLRIFSQPLNWQRAELWFSKRKRSLNLHQVFALELVQLLGSATRFVSAKNLCSEGQGNLLRGIGLWCLL